MTEPALRLITETGELPADAPSYHSLAADLEHLRDQHAGDLKTIEKQAKEIGSLLRQIEREDAELERDPRITEIRGVVERWRLGAGHPNAKVSKDRVLLVRARLKDEYEVEHLELAVDGICAYPFVVNGQRVRDGKKSQRFDRLGIALGGGEKLEHFAVLGHQARKAGWTPAEGWPE